MQATIPYLTVRDAAGASAFYQKAFSAQEQQRMPAEDGKRLMHVHVTIQGGDVFFCDAFPEHGGPGAPQEGETTTASVAIGLKTGKDVDALFKQAVDAGAVGVMEPNDAFLGDRFAMVKDPYGYRWMINGPLAK
jgi:PhnB protein